MVKRRINHVSRQSDRALNTVRYVGKVEPFRNMDIVLFHAGFKPNMVSTKIVKGATSRAGAIADGAKQKNVGTIVMGRRGHVSVRDFFVGRFTNKVIHLAKDGTVWVVR